MIVVYIEAMAMLSALLFSKANPVVPKFNFIALCDESNRTQRISRRESTVVQ